MGQETNEREQRNREHIERYGLILNLRDSINSFLDASRAYRESKIKSRMLVPGSLFDMRLKEAEGQLTHLKGLMEGRDND